MQDSSSLKPLEPTTVYFLLLFGGYFHCIGFGIPFFFLGGGFFPTCSNLGGNLEGGFCLGSILVGDDGGAALQMVYWRTSASTQDQTVEAVGDDAASTQDRNIDSKR